MKALRFFIFFVFLIPLCLLLSAAVYSKMGISPTAIFSMSVYLIPTFIVLHSLWPGWKEFFGRRCPLCHKKFLPHQCDVHGKIVRKNELP